MSIPKQTFFRYIKEFKLKELYNDLGWDNTKLNYPVKVDDQVHTLTGIAEKKGFVIFLCTPDGAQGIPDSAARKKIDNTIARLHHEHLIIYIDEKKSRQHWELLIREQNKPVVSRPIDNYTSQEPELLFQKLEGLFYTFEDEDKLSIVDVRSRVMANFEKNAEVVTKKFYDLFKAEHKQFLGFIKGIQSKVDHEWYASLMLNRLMFIYFIQKKGFLDKNKDYLRARLKAVQSRKGKDKFYSFYRSFLLVLFHQGLGSPVRGAELEAEIGKVPYLNGGLFDVHKLEHDNKDITIEDKAFERIFDFFDEYNWHLDTRITATGKDINPDVIGYIFEKYINDRAAMGAYYTKEDITEYISKNCIVPWLFDEVKRNYAKPFASVGAIHESPLQGNIWSFLQQSGDTYIYPAVKYGIPKSGVGAEHVPPKQVDEDFSDLPVDVQSCIDPNTPNLVEKRKCWNRSAPDAIGLPTEIYREVIARRKRYYEVRRKIEAGEISEINDFITYNLNIRQFAQDVLKETDDPKLIMEFYKAVRKITVLDPTCGSGAFLFAALNVLEPLYFACVTRMREFAEEDGKGKHKFFEEQLALIDADEHPSEEYFIYKSIILHNLYGVDIMKEAVEIAKLRLFLKLVATCDVDYSKPNLGLEPLPDIDFNIRSGNTLVGYATLADLDKGEQGGLFGEKEKQDILEEADVVSRAYARFKDAQLVMHSRQKDGGQADPKTYKDAKDELNNRLTALNDKLNKYLAVTYLGSTTSEKAYEKWLASHQPFHWLAEFYWIIQEGGFDVIIGNPPYIEYQKVLETYRIKDYNTESCGNLYAFVVERSIRILAEDGRTGLIVPISLNAAQRMAILQDMLISRSTSLHLSNFALRPAALFPGIMQRLSIFLYAKGTGSKTFTSDYSTWYAEERATLFNLLTYERLEDLRLPYSIPKFDVPVARSTLRKVLSKKRPWSHYNQFKGAHVVYYHNAGGYWIKTFSFKPHYKSLTSADKTHTTISELRMPSADLALTYLCILNSSLFYFFWKSLTDARHVYPSDIAMLPIELPLGNHLLSESKAVSQRLMEGYKANSERIQYGNAEVDQFYVSQCKPIIDEIDKVLAKHYGFTEEELDFIINYDIKYRMGKELEGEE